MVATGFPEDDDRNIEPEDILPRKEFKPTVNRPLPSYQCTVIKKDGDRCKNHAEMGFNAENALCRAHGGDHNKIKEKNAAIVQAARLTLVDSLDMAVETLVALTRVGTADGVRLKAATEIMDRAGLRGGIDIEIKEDITITTTDDIKSELEKLFHGEAKLRETPDDDDIVDAEVVEVDPPEIDQ